MAEHALLSPSGAEGWLNCPGKLAMERDIPATGSDFADEGTAAHFLASECLMHNADPAAYLNKALVVTEDGARWHQGEVGARYLVDGDMVGPVRKYVQIVQQYAQLGTLMVEQRVPIGHITGEDGAEGTADAVVLTDDGEIIVIDLKYGRGVEVSAHDNSQLKLYALGAYEANSLVADFHHVRLVVCQPRITEAPSEWDTTLEALIAFGQIAKAAAFHALQVLNTELPGAYIHHLRDGDAQCRWCRAKAICPKLRGTVALVTSADFDDLTQTELVVDQGPELLGRCMAKVDLIESWCKAVRAEVERNLLQGVPVPGYKLVEGRRGARKWANEAEAETLLKSMRLKLEEMYDLSLISPTTAEKLQKAGTIGPRQWLKITAMVTQSEGKASVAPASDKRPALTMVATLSEFADEVVEDLA